MMLEDLVDVLGKLRAKVRRKWRKLSDEELQLLESDLDGFVAAVRARYDLSEREVREEIDDLVGHFESTIAELVGAARHAASRLGRARERIHDAWNDGTTVVRGAWQDGARSMRLAKAEVAERIRERPAASLAIAAGIGLLGGLLLFRRRA